MRLALVALIVIVSVPLHGLDRAWPQATDAAAVIDGAKKEGELVIYGTTDLRQATILNEKFRQKYPFIDVKLNRLSTDNLHPRLIAETRSGKFLSDVVQNNTLVMYFLKRGKFLANYVSAEDRYYPNEFKDPGYWITSGTNVHVVGYNIKAVSRDKLPKRWEDLLTPAWKGKMLLRPGEQWFAWILQVMGKENGLNYMRALAQQNLTIRRESNAMRAQLISAGEADLEIDSTLSVVSPLMKNGAPVNWTTLGPTLVVPVAHALATRAPHPNAAKLFIDFVLSREGQRIVLASERNSARADLAQEQSALKEAKLIPLDPSQGENLEFYARQAHEIFGK